MAKFLLVFLFFHLASSKPLNETITKELFSKCGADKCSTVEAPLCIRVKSQYNGTKKSFHIMVFNKCEMQYFKCHQGMEATVVPMKKCGHGSHQRQAPKPKKRSKRVLPAAGVKKRSKRDASAATSKKKNDTRRRTYYSDEEDSFINYEAYGQNTIYELKKNHSKPELLNRYLSNSKKKNKPGKSNKNKKSKSKKKAKQVNELYEYSEGMDYGKGTEYGGKEGGSEYANNGDYDMSDDRVQFYSDNDKKGNSDQGKSSKEGGEDDYGGDYNEKKSNDKYPNKYNGDDYQEGQVEQDYRNDGNYDDDAVINDGYDNDNYGGDDLVLQGTFKGKGSANARGKQKKQVIVKDLKKFDEHAAEFSRDIDEFMNENYKIVENRAVQQKAQKDDVPGGAVDVDDDDDALQQSPEDPQLEMPPPGDGPKKLNFQAGLHEAVWASQDYDDDELNPASSGKAGGYYKSREQGNKMGLVKDLENGDWKQFTDDCPTECPVRDRMVCARCVHNIYRTFMSTCHMRMYACHDRSDKLELITRLPCAISAPYFYDLPDVTHRLSEPHDDDFVIRFLYCRMKGLGVNNPDPKFEITNTRCKRE